MISFSRNSRHDCGRLSVFSLSSRPGGSGLFCLKPCRLWAASWAGLCFISVFAASGLGTQSLEMEGSFDQRAVPLFEQFCFKCHSSKGAKGDINLESLAGSAQFAADFGSWELVVAALKEKQMPPEDEPQPSGVQRRQLVQLLEDALRHTVQERAGDPGRVVLRRLTSAEYAYTIEDLTGLKLGLEKTFLGEAVGGEGFSNVGDVQFIQDSAIERFLDAAKTVASHALIGAGPIQFYQDPGKTGQELSAIHRIKRIYRAHGFRTGAGEGAEAFGLEMYPKAFYAAWRYRHRQLFGEEDLTLAQLAHGEGISPHFLEHIWSVLGDDLLLFPGREVVEAWWALPAPSAGGVLSEKQVRAACQEIYVLLAGWQRALAANSKDDEEAPVLSEGAFRPTVNHEFRVRVNWPRDATVASIELSVIPAGGEDSLRPAILWKQPRVFMRSARSADDAEERRRPSPKPLREIVSEETARRMRFGQGPEGSSIEPNDFMTVGAVTLAIEFPVPAGSRGATLVVDAQLDVERGDDCLVRCVISDGIVEGETVASTGASSALLANPEGPQIDSWRSGVAKLVRTLPQVSHREAAPSDRDPIPLPFDNTYNTPERNAFHYIIKYHRDDAFLTEHILDEATRDRLDQAWTDLLTAFDYHDTFLGFIAKKFEFDLEGRSVETIDGGFVDGLPDEAREFVRHVLEEYRMSQRRLHAVQPSHLDDAVGFARQAWRRPLSQREETRLRSFYASVRRDQELGHADAMRALLARILVAPAFLYRLENPPEAAGMVALSDWELASRLSYFLWSSKPDAELQRAAAAGELRDSDQLALQVRRMLRHPKARRLAVEFFGQWFGFYRFDEFRGIDTERFTEFNDELKSALYDEAISFFEYIVREGRPIDEVLFADYTFLNERLARHYGIERDSVSGSAVERVDNIGRFKRGGVLRLGAILATTSAPLRTSAVKRGDWITRRVLGTPVPPPPGDAGFIPADDVLDDGLTVRERLEAHRSDATCVNCHARIDPLGFALEHFDPLGRWRATYRDGRAIDTTGVLNTGREISGLDDLRDYLKEQAASFHRTLCVKLLGYALGRGVLISDRPLLDQMVASVVSDSRFSNLVEQVVTSTQFRNQRGRDADSRDAGAGDVASLLRGTE